MSYKRKTKDIYIILTNYGYGWEEESFYSYDDYNEPYKEAKKVFIMHLFKKQRV